MLKNVVMICMVLLYGALTQAADLTNKATTIGPNSQNPKNEFVKCVVKNGLKAAFGGSREVFAYTHSFAVGNDDAPEVVAISFISQDKDGAKEILRAYLTSTDLEKKWQYIADGTGEISFFSTRVSATVALVKKDGATEITKYDITSCQ